MAEDAVSRRLRELADTWRATAAASNDELAQRIREDAVDIVVDLAGHSGGGRRMALFARKPAPIQVSWIGYLNTTGLETMDYRITDWHACPAGMERYHTERLIRLPHSQWCYAPVPSAPDVGPLPARANHAITFGSFHNLQKLTPDMISLWARLLQNVPGSRLLMLGSGLQQISGGIAEKFARHGLDPGRVEFLGRVPIGEYLSLHNRVDLNLDAFPYAGGTSSLHSLWMGVPVVSLAGRHVASRGGASILGVLGLTELIAETEDEYMAIAISLAGDWERLERWRRELRARLERSPLMDAGQFTRHLEDAYRGMWRRWCSTRERRPAETCA